MQGRRGSGSKRARDDRFPDPEAWPELLAALDWLPLATLVLAADASAVAVNQAWVALSATARGDSLGDGWLTVVEPVDRATVRSRLSAPFLCGNDTRRGDECPRTGRLAARIHLGGFPAGQNRSSISSQRSSDHQALRKQA